jgi:hypothetical protein
MTQDNESKLNNAVLKSLKSNAVFVEAHKMDALIDNIEVGDSVAAGRDMSTKFYPDSEDLH